MIFFCKNEWTIAIHMKFPIINAISQKWHLSQPPPPSRPSPNWPPHHQKKKKNKQTKNNNMEIQPEGEVACLIWKWKRTRECFWRIEDQPSMKSDVYTRLFFFFSLSLGNFQLYYSIGYWPNPYHRSPLDTLPCSFHKIKRRTKSFKQFQK